jgi:hypothetical protein
MDTQLVGTLSYGDFKADIYSTSAPGEFKIIYHDASGNPIEEAPLTGISTYKQREAEILDRLRQFSEGAQPAKTPYLGDAGEY